MSHTKRILWKTLSVLSLVSYINFAMTGCMVTNSRTAVKNPSHQSQMRENGAHKIAVLPSVVWTETYDKRLSDDDILDKYGEDAECALACGVLAGIFAGLVVCALCTGLCAKTEKQTGNTQQLTRALETAFSHHENAVLIDQRTILAQIKENRLATDKIFPKQYSEN